MPNIRPIIRPIIPIIHFFLFIPIIRIPNDYRTTPHNHLDNTIVLQPTPVYLISLHHIIIKEPGEKNGIRGPQRAAGEPGVGYQFFLRGVGLSSIRNNNLKNRYFNIRHENRIKVTFFQKNE